MKTAIGLLTFLVMYVAYHLTSDPTPCEGWVRTFYLSHFPHPLSVAIIPLVLISYVRAWPQQLLHRKIARITFPICHCISSLLGSSFTYDFTLLRLNSFPVIFLLFALLLLPSRMLSAQCSMCRAVLESEEGKPRKGINDGIVYLMAMPYILVTVVGVVVCKWCINNFYFKL